MINRETHEPEDGPEEGRPLTSESFARLVRSNYGELIEFACRYQPSPTVAEDIVQDVFARVWERRAGLGRIRSLRGYLFRAVRNASLNAIRDRKPSMELDGSQAVDAMPDDAAQYAELLRDFRAAMADLPDRQREAYQLSRLHGLSYEEISDVMGTTLHTTRSHVAAALKHIRTRLADYL